MAGTGLYKSMVASDATVTEAGMLKAWFTPIEDFTTLQEPVLSDPQVLGEENNIALDHVWQAGKGAIKLLVDPDTLTAPGESSGEVRSLRLIRRPAVYILGDGPVVQEIVENIMNQPGILIVQKDCDADSQYIQYGCDCYPAIVEKVTEAQGAVLAGGKVGYEMTFRSLCKRFYNGAITERT